MKLAALALLAILPAGAARQVAIVVEGQLDSPARYGIGKLEQALAAKGLTVIRPGAGERTQADFYVVAGIAEGPPQSAAIHRSRRAGKPAVILSGGDTRGLMYAALDTADRVQWSAT